MGQCGNSKLSVCWCESCQYECVWLMTFHLNSLNSSMFQVLDDVDLMAKISQYLNASMWNQCRLVSRAFACVQLSCLWNSCCYHGIDLRMIFDFLPKIDSRMIGKRVNSWVIDLDGAKFVVSPVLLCLVLVGQVVTEKCEMASAIVYSFARIVFGNIEHTRTAQEAFIQAAADL